VNYFYASGVQNISVYNYVDLIHNRNCYWFALNLILVCNQCNVYDNIEMNYKMQICWVYGCPGVPDMLIGLMCTCVGNNLTNELVKCFVLASSNGFAH